MDNATRMSEIKKLEKLLDAKVVHSPLVYSRVVGYYQNTKAWNPGKLSEWSDRVMYEIPKDL